MKIIKPRFDVGFVFDNTTLAMRKGDSYFINPESLLAEIGDFKKSSRFRVVSCLLARAVHEVAHVKHGSVSFILPCLSHFCSYLVQQTQCGLRHMHDRGHGSYP